MRADVKFVVAFEPFDRPILHRSVSTQSYLSCALLNTYVYLHDVNKTKSSLFLDDATTLLRYDSLYRAVFCVILTVAIRR